MESLKSSEVKLEGVQAQMEAAKGEVDHPFPQAKEFEDKSARLKELNILLNMDEKDTVILDGAPDEGDIEPTRQSSNRER